MLTNVSVLMVPGWKGSGPAHWQSVWEQRHLSFRRVEQRDWDRPRRTEWVRTLERSVAISEKPVVLVAHSLGCLTVAHWAQQTRRAHRVAGALLVAPPWLSSGTATDALRDFSPMPLRRLPFSSTLVSSENDPYIKTVEAIALSEAWNSDFVSLGHAGHINAEAGYGEWPQGERLLWRLMREAESRRVSVPEVSVSADEDRDRLFLQAAS